MKVLFVLLALMLLVDLSVSWRCKRRRRRRRRRKRKRYGWRGYRPRLPCFRHFGNKVHAERNSNVVNAGFMKGVNLNMNNKGHGNVFANKSLDIDYPAPCW